jgi:hypothetical protein
MLKPFTKGNMENLVPYGLEAYMKGREAGEFTYELKDPVFEEWSFK